MRNQIFALITLLSTPLATATPHPSPTSAPSATVTPPSSYYLQTRVIGQGHPEKDGLYVCAYHTGTKCRAPSTLLSLPPPKNSSISVVEKQTPTGPGTADLTLQSIDAAAPAFFNSGYQEFNLDPPEPFGITMGDYDNGGTGTLGPLQFTLTSQDKVYICYGYIDTY